MSLYLNIPTLLLILASLVLPRRSNVLAISFQLADTFNAKGNGPIENVYSTRIPKKAAMGMSVGLKGKHVLLDEGPTLIARTDEKAGSGKTNPRNQSKSETSKSSPVLKLSEIDQQPLRHTARRRELVRPQPIKRPRLSRAADGEWKRDENRPSISRGDTKLYDGRGHKMEENSALSEHKLEHKPEQRTNSRVSRVSQAQDFRHQTGSRAMNVPEYRTHLMAGTMFRDQSTHNPHLTWPLNTAWTPARQSNTHIPIFGRPKEETPTTNSQPGIPYVNRAVSAHRLTEKQGIPLQNSASAHRKEAASLPDSRSSLSPSPGTITDSSRASNPSVHSPWRANAARVLPPIPDTAHLPQLIDDRFKIPPSRLPSSVSPSSFPGSVPLLRLPSSASPFRFPSSVPQADRLNEMLDAGRAQRLGFDPRQFGL